MAQNTLNLPISAQIRNLQDPTPTPADPSLDAAVTVGYLNANGTKPLASPKGTISIDTTTDPTKTRVDIAQQSATVGQVLAWDATNMKFAPASRTITANNSNGPTTVTPSIDPATGIPNVAVTWASQPANKVLAGLNSFYIATRFVATPANQIVSNKQTTLGLAIIPSAQNITVYGFDTSVSVTVPSGTPLVNAIQNLFAAVGPLGNPFQTRWTSTWDATFTNNTWLYNGTESFTNGDPTTVGINLVATTADWTNGGDIGSVVRSFTQQSSGIPQFRAFNPDDIAPMIYGTPTQGQIPFWNDVTHTTQWGGIDGIDDTAGIVTEFGNQFVGVYAGANLTGSTFTSNGKKFFRLDAAGGGGGGGPLTVSGIIWAQSGSNTKNAFTDATGTSDSTTPQTSVINFALTPATDEGQASNIMVTFADGTSVVTVGPYTTTGSFAAGLSFDVPIADIGANTWVYTSPNVTISNFTCTYSAVMTRVTVSQSLNNNPIIEPATPTLSAPSVTLAPRSIFASVGQGTVVANLMGGPLDNTTNWSTSSTPPTSSTNTSATWAAVNAGTTINVQVSGTSSGSRGGARGKAWGPLTAAASVNQSTYIPWFGITQGNSNTQPTFDTTTGQQGNSSLVSGQAYTAGPITNGSIWIAVDQATVGTAHFTATFAGTTYNIAPDVTATQTISGRVYNVYGFTTGSGQSNPKTGAAITVLFP